jgi:hypothetical protein
VAIGGAGRDTAAGAEAAVAVMNADSNQRGGHGPREGDNPPPINDTAGWTRSEGETKNSRGTMKRGVSFHPSIDASNGTGGVGVEEGFRIRILTYPLGRRRASS